MEKCYVGIRLPQSFRDDYLEIQAEIKHLIPGAELDDPDWAHVTLFYLGTQSDPHLTEISQTLSSNLKYLKPPEIKFLGIDFFVPQDPKVIFLKLDQTPSLMELNQKLVEILSEYNFPENSFVPHITIARTRDNDSIRLARINEDIIYKIGSNINFDTTINEIELRGRDPDKNYNRFIFQKFILS